ncbi:hypothetical protein BDV95DRAFT_595748 [Massariosphaeria phaeospora]|uniref:Uncharacterized protein n=1 Tax=Massariosphaeria phaeospora TaxID=100035 RepID=A0A7C8IBV0_9PLEO|nr:hypothetical protein BDV95DRAFT_595748 [Massariosphaeria phaeospora]
MSPSPSMALRALAASTLLVLSVTCLWLMDITTLVQKYPTPGSSGAITWPGGAIPILQNFHGVRLLDEVFRDVTVGFAPFSLGYDALSWWGVLTFLQDFGVVYLVLLCESARGVNRWTVAYFPGVFGLLGQLIPAGVMFPFFYFLCVLFCPPAPSARDRAARKIALGDAWVFLPAVVGFHTLPVLGMFFAASYEDRHYWTWFWQLYPVRVFFAYVVVKGGAKMLALRRRGLDVSYQKSVTLLVAPMIAVSAATWIYVLSSSPYSLRERAWPAAVAEETFAMRMRRILQCDALFMFAGTFAWLGYLLGEMWSARLIDAKQVAGFVAVGIASLGAVGPGATVGVLWLWREAFLVGDR